MIEIKVTKIVSKNGKKQYRIESIKGVISKDLLPSKYLKGKPCFWRDDENYTLDNTAGYIYMYRGIVIAEKVFLEIIIKDIMRAGIRLHILNNEKREIEKTWKGEETFII